MQKVIDWAAVATEWKINFPLWKSVSYIHYHISCYVTQTGMFYFQTFRFRSWRSSNRLVIRKSGSWLTRWGEFRRWVGESLYPGRVFSSLEENEEGSGAQPGFVYTHCTWYRDDFYLLTKSQKVWNPFSKVIFLQRNLCGGFRNKSPLAKQKSIRSALLTN